MRLVAGVDSSTQSCKVVIRDLDTGELVRSGRASHPDGTEVDPEAWWGALKLAIEAAGGLVDVEAISIGGQQHGMVALDIDGRVIRKALLWNDTRSAAAAEELIDYFGAQYLADQTGSIPVASFTISKVLWLRQNEPENAARVAAICLPHDWLTWRLAGFGPANESRLGPDLGALCTDASDASGTGYFNPQTGHYLNDLIDFALGHVPILPRVIGPGTVAHEADNANPITRALIGAGCGDNAGAGLGLAANVGDVVVSLGTSGTVFAVSETPTNDSSGTIAGFASASGSYLPLVCTLNAARVLDSFSRLFEVTHAELSELALQAASGSEGIVLLPYFEGERTPNLPEAKASIHGLTLSNHTRPNLARAAIEGMICGLADGLSALLVAGVSCKRVILIGGAAMNPAVQLVAAEVFGVEVVVALEGEYVADGAARQAAISLTKTDPGWRIETVELAPLTPRPSILENYRKAFESQGF